MTDCTTQPGPARLSAIFGTGRSGSTWLGAIAASHPEVVYRFEPFHRLRFTVERVRRAWELMESDSFGAADIETVYEALRPADPASEKPPFFRSRVRRRVTAGRTLLWPVCRRVGALAAPYRWLYSPRGRPPLVFKEVAYLQVMEKLLHGGRTPIVYLVRHPAAVVSSTLRGQAAGLMPARSRAVLAGLLEAHCPEAARRYLPRLDGLRPAEAEALLWRADVERALRMTRAHDGAVVILYEELCDETRAVATRVLEHLGLEMTEPTMQFIDEVAAGGAARRLHRGELLTRGYFSVFRDPAATRDRWRREIDADDHRGVLAAVEDSEMWKLGVERGVWKE